MSEKRACCVLASSSIKNNALSGVCGISVYEILSSGSLGWTDFIHPAFSSSLEFFCAAKMGTWDVGQHSWNLCKSFLLYCHIFFYFHCSNSLSQISALTCWQKVCRTDFCGQKAYWVPEKWGLCALMFSDTISADFLAVKEFLSETMMCCLHPLRLYAAMNAMCFVPQIERKF